MNPDVALPTLAGTLLCLLGFARFPTRMTELLAPRFVIPAVLWMSTFGKALLAPPAKMQFVDYAVQTYSGEALWFVNLCVAAFWAGYALPVGKWLSRLIPDLSFSLSISPRLLMALATCLAAYIHVIPHVAFAFGAIQGLLLRAASAAALGGAALVGVAWGSSRKTQLAGVVLGAVLLFAYSAKFMATFSRGSGLPVLMAVFAASYVRREIRVVPLTLALAWTIYAGVQGLSGRAIYGHFSGLGSYWTNILEHPIPRVQDPSHLLVLFHDVYSPLCVSVRARSEGATLTGVMDPRDWLLNQIPVPRFLGLPNWTVNLGKYITGNRKTEWGYTNSMVGDLYLHFGRRGCFGFLVVGIVYRAVAVIVTRVFSTTTVIFDWYALIGLATYYAFALGMYNNFRSWNNFIFYAIYATLGLYLVSRPFARTQPALSFSR